MNSQLCKKLVAFAEEDPEEALAAETAAQEYPMTEEEVKETMEKYIKELDRFQEVLYDAERKDRGEGFDDDDDDNEKEEIVIDLDQLLAEIHAAQR